jgi:hypothetical protein
MDAGNGNVPLIGRIQKDMIAFITVVVNGVFVL